MAEVKSDAKPAEKPVEKAAPAIPASPPAKPRHVDRGGNGLQVGDLVWVPCRITGLYETSVSLRLEVPTPETGQSPYLSLAKCQVSLVPEQK